jgi:hypothetical protein
MTTDESDETQVKVTQMTGPRGHPYEQIEVPNRLAAKVGGFRVDPEAVARVQARLEALSAQYPEVAQPDLDRLAALWQRLRGGGGTEEEAEALRRIAHDFKGQGASLGYPLISDIGASLGELLRGADLSSELVKQAVDQHVAALGAVLHGRITGDGGDHGRALSANLRRLVEKCLAG